MENIEQLKSTLYYEIKILISELYSMNSLEDFLQNDQKIKQLSSHLIFAQQLQIWEKKSPKKLFNEKKISETPEISIIKFHQTQDNEVTIINEDEKTPKTVETPQEIQEKKDKIKLAHIKHFTSQKAASSSSAFQSDFKLDLNDRIAFAKTLFDNNTEEMDKTVAKLNECTTLEKAKEYLSEVYYEKNWQQADDYAQRLWVLVESKF